MPNRIIREAILSSERVAQLGWGAEVFYRRLLSIIDDYGRFEANSKLLRSKCYPLQTDDVSLQQVSEWIGKCANIGLVLLYVSSGKEYLEVLNFGQQVRSKSKFPDPPSDASKCSQVLADAHLVVSVSGGVSGVEDVSVVVNSEPNGSGGLRPPPVRPVANLRDQVFATGVLLLTQASVTDKNARSFLAAQCKAHGEEKVLQALELCAEQRPGEPVPWLVEVLKRSDGKRAAPTSFAQQERETGMKRWEDMTGRIHPDRKGGAIDIKSTDILELTNELADKGR